MPRQIIRSSIKFGITYAILNETDLQSASDRCLFMPRIPRKSSDRFVRLLDIFNWTSRSSYIHWLINAFVSKRNLRLQACLFTFTENFFRQIFQRTCQPYSRARHWKTKNQDCGISLFLARTYHRAIRLFPDSSFDPPSNLQSLFNRSSSLASSTSFASHGMRYTWNDAHDGSLNNFRKYRWF